MLLIGLAGSAGAGKDTIADYLVEQYGFVKFSFSDRLYAEVAAAFKANSDVISPGYELSEDVLRDRGIKERAFWLLKPKHCLDGAFRVLMEREYINRVGGRATQWGYENYEFSPRWVLQHWGTEYRRAQDPDYWVNATRKWIDAWLEVMNDTSPERRPIGLVNSSVRFENERALIDEFNGQTWHVRRFINEINAAASGVASELHHVAEQPMDVRSIDREIFNSGTVEQLHSAVSLALQSGPTPAAYVSAVDFVACDNCGKVHTPMTEAQALAECMLYNEYLSNLSDESRGAQHEITPNSYRGCIRCGESAFTPWYPYERNDPVGATIPPVIYGANE